MVVADQGELRIRVLHLSLLVPQLELANDFQPVTHESVGTTNCHILERLSIEVLHSYMIEFSSVHFRLYDQILSPTHVSFNNIAPVEISIRWKHVTWVEAPCIQIYDALDILQMAPQLQHFKFGPHDDDDFYDDETIMITHKSLKSLDLTNLSPETFLNCIKCPALEELSISMSYYDDPLYLENFLKRSKCSLASFTHLPYGDAIAVVPVLRFTPSITHLSLQGCGIPDKFLEAFMETTAAGGNTEFLPHLRSFTCTVSFEGFQWSKIPSMTHRSHHEKDMVSWPLSKIKISEWHG